MNNRGFGIIWVFGFIVLMAIALCSLYSFMITFLTPFLSSNNSVPNYKNVYTIYMKEHNIVLEK